VAGLEAPSEGSVTLRASDAKPGTLPSAMVFQERSLFPWMRVRENVAFGFDRVAVAPQERDRRVDAQLALVGLTRFAQAFPHELSGGMSRRVAVARAFAVEPQVLFMDEPFGALDEQTRVALGAELEKIWEASRPTVLLVTHSIEEALALSDRVVVMSQAPGRVAEIVDVPFARPRDPIDLRANPEFGRLSAHIWKHLRSSLIEQA
jgi:NitT/TauT family transport system ATP-binding protein